MYGVWGVYVVWKEECPWTLSIPKGTVAVVVLAYLDVGHTFHSVSTDINASSI